MKAQTWVIIGATSIIAEEFARLAAKAEHDLLLVGRDRFALEIIAVDLQLRYSIKCEIIAIDLADNAQKLMTDLQNRHEELALFIAASFIKENSALTPESIEKLINVNILSITLLINAYLQKKQSEHRVIFLSSVAACKGRSKNSLYGASKAAIDVYLQGLQQTASKTQHISIVRLGFIDTAQTFGRPGIFYASPPKACAKACWKASYAGKRHVYHPFFWRYIMMIITHLPFFLYKRMGNV